MRHRHRDGNLGTSDRLSTEIGQLTARVGRYDAGALLAAAAIMQPGEHRRSDARAQQEMDQIVERLHDWLQYDDAHLAQVVVFARDITRAVIHEYSHMPFRPSAATRR